MHFNMHSGFRLCPLPEERSPQSEHHGQQSASASCVFLVVRRSAKKNAKLIACVLFARSAFRRMMRKFALAFCPRSDGFYRTLRARDLKAVKGVKGPATAAAAEEVLKSARSFIWYAWHDRLATVSNF